jgi:hypothetical protein
MIYTHKHDNLLTILITIFILTVGDAFFSAFEVKRGWMTEGNLLIRDAVMSYPIETGAIIAFVVGLILLGVWQIRHKIAWLRNAMISVMVVKSGIIVYHLVGISQAIYQW